MCGGPPAVLEPNPVFNFKASSSTLLGAWV